jgi:D-psicose/D-tagatose/L-ribulose 3-epimerase
LTDQALAELAPRIRDWGFDAIELPIQGMDWDPQAAAALLADLNLEPVVCAGLLPDHDLLSDDPETVRRTTEFIDQCVQMAAQVGASIVAGPLYAPAGRRWRLDAESRRATIARLVTRLRPVAEVAAAAGVTLALEPLNRFDGSLLNTVAQTREVVDGVPGLGIMLDTFHMHIEERDLAAAVGVAGDRLVHVQVCGNDRGVPGEDLFDWPTFFTALSAVGYSGIVSIESFTAETLAVPMSVWRPLTDHPDKLAAEGLAFLRSWAAELTRLR